MPTCFGRARPASGHKLIYN